MITFFLTSSTPSLIPFGESTMLMDHNLSQQTTYRSTTGNLLIVTVSNQAQCKERSVYFLIPGLFSCLFKQTIQIEHQINVKNVHSVFEPTTSDYESPPITPRL